MPVPRRLWEVECKLDMTPMIDCTFLLIIFFLCTIRFKVVEGELAAHLPRDVGVNRGASEPIERIDVEIEVSSAGERRDPIHAEQPWNGKGRFQLKDHRVRFRVGPVRIDDLSELEQRLDVLHRAAPTRELSIRAKPGVVVGDVVPVLDAAVRVGFEDVSFRA